MIQVENTSEGYNTAAFLFYNPIIWLIAQKPDLALALYSLESKHTFAGSTKKYTFVPMENVDCVHFEFIPSYQTKTRYIFVHLCNIFTFARFLNFREKLDTIT